MWKSKANENKNNTGPMILVVEDIEETRDGIEKLLTSDGYRVNPARDEEDAVDRAKREPPGLILVSVAGPHAQVIALAARVRQRAELSDDVPRTACRKKACSLINKRDYSQRNPAQKTNVPLKDYL
jgi:CheY-like chemotaxis protein